MSKRLPLLVLPLLMLLLTRVGVSDFSISVTHAADGESSLPNQTTIVIDDWYNDCGWFERPCNADGDFALDVDVEAPSLGAVFKDTGIRQSWRDHAYWARATSSGGFGVGQYSGIAQWTVNIRQSGWYYVEAYIPNIYTQMDDTVTAEYEVYSSDGVDYIILDQSQNIGEWAMLGEYYFEGSGSSTNESPDSFSYSVTLSTHTDDYQYERSILFDAVRWRNVDGGNTGVTVNSWLQGYNNGDSVSEGTRLTHCYSVSEPVYIRWTFYHPQYGWQLIVEGEDNGNGDCQTSQPLSGLGERRIRIEALTGQGGSQLAIDESYFQVVSSVPTSIIPPAPTPRLSTPTPIPTIRPVPTAPPDCGIDLSGMVTLAQGRLPVPGVQIVIENTRTGWSAKTISQQNGSYQFEPVSAGDYLIRTNREGYRDNQSHIVVSGCVQHNIPLDAESSRLMIDPPVKEGSPQITNYVDHQFPEKSIDAGYPGLLRYDGLLLPDPSSWVRITGHNGLDIAHPSIRGKPVLAVAGGVLQVDPVGIYSANTGYPGNIQGGGYGNYIVIDHDNGYTTRYGHLNSVDGKVKQLKKGAKIDPGQVLGTVGCTGNTSFDCRTGDLRGTHLHFEFWHDGVVLDPLGWWDNPQDDPWAAYAESYWAFKSSAFAGIKRDLLVPNESLMQQSIDGSARISYPQEAFSRAAQVSSLYMEEAVAIEVPITAVNGQVIGQSRDYKVLKSVQLSALTFDGQPLNVGGNNLTLTVRLDQPIDPFDPNSPALYRYNESRQRFELVERTVMTENGLSASIRELGWFRVMAPKPRAVLTPVFLPQGFAN